MASTTNPEPIKIVIDNKLYDVTKFAKIHPGGEVILRDFHNCECTDYFYALHSKEANQQLHNMRSEDIDKKDIIPETNLAKLTKKLEAEGWMKSDWKLEVSQMVHSIGALLMATYLAYSYPFFAALFFCAGTLSGGWIAHMNDHQRGNCLRKVNLFYTTIFLGFSPSWWSEKHNRHHLSTNEKENDGDIMLFPFIYLWNPKKSQDSWNRKFQNFYFTALYSILHLKWWVDSTLYTYNNKLWTQFFLTLVHWTWCFCLPWKVWLLGVLLSGLLAAFVVTASHQGEKKWDSKKQDLSKNGEQVSKYKIHDFAEHQIVSTRNFYMKSWLLNYISGCMQYQTEHHLFPRIPMYKLALVRPIAQQFCKDNGIEYLEEGVWEIMARNYGTIDMFAHSKAE